MKRNSEEISTEVGTCTINTEVSEIISWSFEYIKKKKNIPKEPFMLKYFTKLVILLHILKQINGAARINTFLGILARRIKW